MSIVLVLLISNISSVLSLKVLVTGAAGRTGSLALKKLLDIPSVKEVRGLVKSKQSSDKLKKLLGRSFDGVVLADVVEPSDELDAAFKGVDAVILATSAVPKIKIFSLIKSIVFKIFKKTVRPEFTFPVKGDPYFVDWLGAKNQIDAAKRNGVKHFVFVSSMGVTQPDNFLNTIGRVDGDDKSGNILIWKKKAEDYLMKSGMAYTIIHPGGLTDKPGGEREIVLGVNDELLANEKERSIPRADVAEVAVQALLTNSAKNKNIDIISRAGTATKDWSSFFSKTSKK